MAVQVEGSWGLDFLNTFISKLQLYFWSQQRSGGGLYGTVTSSASGVHEMKIGPITFQVATGDIAKEEADVIVNSTTKTFDHKAGVSKAILEKAGQNVEIECSRLAQQHNNGYIITGGGALKCKNIIHVDGGADVKRSVTCVLQECEKRNHSTICLPAIGTGCAQQDPDKVAEAIMDAIEDFIQKGLVQAVKKVKVVIFQPQIMDVFCANMKKRKGSQAPPESLMTKIACLYGTVTSSASGVHEMKIGPITFQVATGDIAKEEADVIVNSTTKTFDHKAGVSKAILEKAGQNVEIECSRLAQQHNNGYIITGGGALKCKNIIHVDGGADVKRSVTCVLQECEKRNHSTICLPAIGTGCAQQDPDKVAEAIMDAIEDFIQKGLVQAVKKVKVVIFQPQIMDVFCANMKKRKGSQAPPESLMTKIACLYGTVTSSASGVHEMKIGPITFQVATGDIAKEEADVIVNSTTKTFDHKAGVSKAILEKAGQKVEIQCSRLAQQHNNGYIITDGGALKCQNIIHVDGGADVKRSVTCVLQECERRNLSTICLPAIGTGSAQQDPDKVAEAIMDAIEDFIQKGLVWSVKKVKVVIFQPQIMGVFSANMKKREGFQAPSESIRSKIAFEIPGHWSDMKQQCVCLVELQPGLPEYSKVADAFRQTCSQFKIEKIERIQNRSLWQQYQTKKKTMDDKNGRTQNEKLLFHGTDADSLAHINQHGFNRSYAGKNAVLYGKGTYFAVQALYSADDTYSRPDTNEKKYMYYVRVLTGLYTLGNESLLVPPPKNPQNPFDLYDTVTDNVNTPSLFVVFYDYQAYPEYLITFKK